MSEPRRCSWCAGEPAMVAYHDREWGVPLHDDRRHFEFLVLDAAQAGLSWRTILLKRDSYRRAFDGFDPQKVARYTPRRIAKLLQDPGLVRNRLKIESAVQNARAFLDVQDRHGSFDAYVWRFVDGAPRVHRFRSPGDVPATSAESDALSRDMKQRHFTFCGSTICYAYMQAAGLVNDHLLRCHRWREVQARRGPA